MFSSHTGHQLVEEIITKPEFGLNVSTSFNKYKLVSYLESIYLDIFAMTIKSPAME